MAIDGSEEQSEENATEADMLAMIEAEDMDSL